MMISDAGLRGVAPEVMAETAHAVRTDREVGPRLDELAAWCTAHERREALSQELDVLLYTENAAGTAGKERC